MTSWKFYDDNAERLFNDYVSLSFYDIFQDVAVFFSNSINTVLDVGFLVPVEMPQHLRIWGFTSQL